MLFSAHVVDTTPLATLRRRAPDPGVVPGLRSARAGTAAMLNGRVTPRLQPRRQVVVACWDDEASLDDFLATNEVGRVLSDGWTVRMRLFRAIGVFPGMDDDLRPVARATPSPSDGPVVAITIGTTWLRVLLPFARANAPLEAQFLDAPGAMWGTTFSNPAQRLVATLTVWESVEATRRYATSDAHGDAIAAHFDPARDPTGHTYTTDGGFMSFAPLSFSGHLGGPNPIPAAWASASVTG